jgi:hypothetical protein
MKASSLYCMRCKAHRMCKNVKPEHDVRGKPRLHGVCKACGTHCYQYVSGKSATRRSRSRGRRSATRRSRSRGRM